MLRKILCAIYVLGAFFSTAAYSQIEPLTSDVTKKSAKRNRDQFFLNPSAQAAYADALKTATRSKDSRVIEKLNTVMFAKWNQSSKEWLESYRGVHIQFEPSMTEYEKADYYTRLIGFLRDLEQEGVSDSKKVGSKLNLNIYAYRSQAEASRLRDLWGDEVVQRLGVYATQTVQKSDRAYVLKRLDVDNPQQWGGTSYRTTIVKQDSNYFVNVIDSLRNQLVASVPVEFSEELDRLKDRMKLVDQAKSTEGKNGILAFHVTEDEMKGWEYEAGIMVKTKGEAGYVEDEWVRFNTIAYGREGHVLEGLTSKQLGAFENAQMIYINNPAQLPLTYWQADRVFRAKIASIQDERAQREAEEILRKYRVEQRKADEAADAEVGAILRKLAETDTTCPK